jgi:hypothetical protein
VNTVRVLAELPADMGTWMQTHGTPDQWDATARAVAISIGHALLAPDGEAGNTRWRYARLLRHESVAVRTIAAGLGCGTRRWTKAQVSAALIEYFALYSFSRLERRLSSTDKLPTTKVA